jgi:hypothetical protein
MNCGLARAAASSLKQEKPLDPLCCNQNVVSLPAGVQVLQQACKMLRPGKLLLAV